MVKVCGGSSEEAERENFRRYGEIEQMDVRVMTCHDVR